MRMRVVQVTKSASVLLSRYPYKYTAAIGTTAMSERESARGGGGGGGGRGGGKSQCVRGCQFSRPLPFGGRTTDCR